MNQLSPFIVEQVQAARIMVVGCGALGNEVLKNLVLMGVQHLVLVDFDRIEPDNLSRSILFSREDAANNRLKVEAAAERLLQMNPDLDLTTINGDICYDVGLGLLRRMNVVVGCVDNRWARYCINRLCMRANIPWVDGGIDGLEGTARVFIPCKNCYACNLGPEGLKDLARRMPCAGIIRRNIEAGKVPTTSIVASIIGAVQAQEALKLATNSEATTLCGKMFYYEGQHLTSKIVDFKAYDDDCPVHEQWTDIRPSTLTVNSTIAEVLHTTNGAAFYLTNDCFVDYIENRKTGEKTTVNCPGHLVKVANPEDYYQHEFRVIDQACPYPDLTLRQLGIPPNDVLHIQSAQEDYYLEMDDGRNI